MYFEFYCESPSVFAKAGWKEGIDRLFVQGFGANDPEAWNADRLLVMKGGDEYLAAATLDLFDFGFDGGGKRLWIESLTIPDHSLKADVSLFSLFWEFIWESIEDFNTNAKQRVSLLVEEYGKDKDRLVGMYTAKGMKVEQAVKIGKTRYLVMVLP